MFTVGALVSLNEATLLQNVRQRYHKNKIYVSARPSIHHILSRYQQLERNVVVRCRPMWPIYCLRSTPIGTFRRCTLPRRCSNIVEDRSEFFLRMFLLLVSKLWNVCLSYFGVSSCIQAGNHRSSPSVDYGHIRLSSDLGVDKYGMVQTWPDLGHAQMIQCWTNIFPCRCINTMNVQQEYDHCHAIEMNSIAMGKFVVATAPLPTNSITELWLYNWIVFC